MLNSKGLLFVIESGSDASGKQTQTEMIYQRLKEEGHKVVKISFPNYESPSSALVKMYLNGDFSNDPNMIDPKISSSFYAVDRYASYKTHWGKLLEEGYIVITDRYTTSNMVHQAGKLEGESKEEYLKWLYDYEYGMFKLPIPDEVVFLNMPCEVSQELIAQRNNKIDNSGKKDIHESNSEYLKKCYLSSLELVEKYNWKKVDCVKEDKIRTREDISSEIYSIISNKISNVLG